MLFNSFYDLKFKRPVARLHITGCGYAKWLETDEVWRQTFRIAATLFYYLFQNYAIQLLSYGAGLRVSEAVNLKIQDIDLQELTIHPKLAKGKRDRITVFPEKLTFNIQNLIAGRNKTDFVFASERGGRLSERTAQKVFENALKKASINKQATFHSLCLGSSVPSSTIILVDDGTATGMTMKAAIDAMRKLKPSKIITALPVAPPDTAKALHQLSDEAVILETALDFHAVGQFYEDFAQVETREVKILLNLANQPQLAHAAKHISIKQTS